ncbi:PepSY-associated TM helix domain-containing protein [Leisingera aquaemixtae]|uniref:Putative iron-regulated membrane protein n=1 Tax=Leisingera aquaemixtae TaxID=1396826 RepID=A0A0P1HWN2_9RHOB|nr:PepSY domain-containing protein [Leisingera aquaemixtae]CUH99472.1 putative iron-regulated membrane protein [Leisingera aquaemixtae]
MAPSQPHSAGQSRPLTDKFYFAVWRWHFYAGLFVIPFLIMLAVTGLMMMFITQVDGRDGEKIPVTPAPAALSLPEQEAAVLAAQPGTIAEWIGPKAPGLAAVFRVKSDDGQRLVALNQYTGEVIEVWDRRAGWYDLADNIHSTLLIGDTGDRLIEISAGLGLVLVLTGLYLWWPRGNAASALVPNFRARGRALWKSLHAVTGFWMSALLVVFLISGLSWTGIWGGQIMQAWSTFPAAKWDNVPLSDDIHASMNHGHTNDVPWALEQTPMPASGSDAGITGVTEGAPVDAASLIALGRALGMEGRFRLAYPGGETGVWTLNRDSMSGDGDSPFIDRTVHVDQYSGRILADVKYEDYSWAGKAMAVSIPFHMGLMGSWSFVLNVVFCLAVIFVCLSGLVMWVKRRPAGAARLAAPPEPAEMPFWKGAALIAVLVSLAFPLTGLTLLAVLAFDVLLLGNLPVLKRAVS